MREWPAPMLQPDPSRDCGLYAAAYLARCLGHPEVTVEDVRAFCGEIEQDWRAAFFSWKVLGHDMQIWWDDQDIEADRRRWWLGAEARGWVAEHLAAGDIGALTVERTASRRHSVVLLEDRGEAGALIMDPLSGFVVEPWSWVLGPGAGHGRQPGEFGSHHIEAWYSAIPGPPRSQPRAAPVVPGSEAPA